MRDRAPGTACMVCCRSTAVHMEKLCRSDQENQRDTQTCEQALRPAGCGRDAASKRHCFHYNAEDAGGRVSSSRFRRKVQLTKGWCSAPVC